jgi:hypothetical protein
VESSRGADGRLHPADRSAVSAIVAEVSGKHGLGRVNETIFSDCRPGTRRHPLTLRHGGRKDRAIIIVDLRLYDTWCGGAEVRRFRALKTDLEGALAERFGKRVRYIETHRDSALIEESIGAAVAETGPAEGAP